MAVHPAIVHLSAERRTIPIGEGWRSWLHAFSLRLVNDGDQPTTDVHWHIDTRSDSLFVHSNLAQSNAPCKRTADNHFECDIRQIEPHKSAEYGWSVRSREGVEYDLILTVDPHGEPQRASYHVATT